MAKDKQILLVAQKSAEIDDPSMRDIHDVGTLSTILQLLKLPDGTIKVLVEAMITSVGNAPCPLDCPITDLAVGGLPAPSKVRFKLFTLDHRLVFAGCWERSRRQIAGR